MGHGFSQYPRVATAAPASATSSATRSAAAVGTGMRRPVSDQTTVGVAGESGGGSSPSSVGTKTGADSASSVGTKIAADASGVAASAAAERDGAIA